MEIARNDLLAGSGSALNEDRRLGRRNRLRHVEHVEPRLARSYRARNVGVILTPNGLFEGPILDAQHSMLRGATENREQLVVLKGLLDVIEGARVHRLHRRLKRYLRGH